jgi:hypothetical protein
VLTVSRPPEGPAARWGRLVDLFGKGKAGFAFFSARRVFLSIDRARAGAAAILAYKSPSA